MKSKTYKIPKEKLKKLVDSDIACIASDIITVDGKRVKYMYREAPENDFDSGWRFFSGEETQEYTDDYQNFSLYKINTIVNYDAAILGYLDFPYETCLERILGTNKFVVVENTSGIVD